MKQEELIRAFFQYDKIKAERKIREYKAQALFFLMACGTVIVTGLIGVLIILVTK